LDFAHLPQPKGMGAEALLWMLGALVLLAGLSFRTFKTWLNSRITAGVQHQFNERLQEHKHTLEMAAEEAQFEYQRRIADFNLYSAKVHDSYAELWKRIRYAYSRVIDLRQERSLEFEYYNADDVESRLTREEIPSGKRTAVLKIWNDDRPAGVKALNEVLRYKQLHNAVNGIIEANAAFLSNELYLSDEVSQLTGIFLVHLEHVRLFIQEPERTWSGEGQHMVHEASDMLKTLKAAMRKDMTRGYYTP
jgi:hypothetical protein